MGGQLLFLKRFLLDARPAGTLEGNGRGCASDDFAAKFPAKLAGPTTAQARSVVANQRILDINWKQIKPANISKKTLSQVPGRLE